MKPLLILFAKAPVAGRVKTRLSSVLTPLKSARFHERLVSAAWAQLNSFNLGSDVELHTDVETDAWPEAASRRLQVEGDLGARMYAALSRALAEGRPQAGIVGGDTWGLPESHLLGLLQAKADVALGPAEDGGYYAIACRRVHPEMFAGVRWSTVHALTDTVAACARVGLSVAIGASWFDIDTPEDLKRLPSSLLE